MPHDAFYIGLIGLISSYRHLAYLLLLLKASRIISMTHMYIADNSLTTIYNGRHSDFGPDIVLTENS